MLGLTNDHKIPYIEILKTSPPQESCSTNESTPLIYQRPRKPDLFFIIISRFGVVTGSHLERLPGCQNYRLSDCCFAQPTLLQELPKFHDFR